MQKTNLAVRLETLTEKAKSAVREKAMDRVQVNDKLISIGIFFGAILALLFYLLALRNEVDLPVAMFFISIALIVLSLLYQILFIDLARGFAGMVIFEITLAAIAFHYIYQIPSFGLYGTDAYLDMASMQSILESGHIAGVAQDIQITSFFPVIHLMGAELSLVTGIDYYSIAKWFPAIIAAITIPMIYILVRFLFKQEKAALLAALLFACIQHYVMFGSLFVRETVGIILAISSVYFFVAAKSSAHPVIYRSLAILSLGGTIIAHHLTSVMLLMMLAIYWVFSFLVKAPTPEQKLNGDEGGYRMSLSFLLIGVIGVLAYWLTTVVQPVQIGLYFLDNLITPGTWGLRTILDRETVGAATLPNLRYYFLVYGSYISYFIFGLILVYKSFSRRGIRSLEVPVFTLYLLICGVLGFMSYFVLPPTVGGDRFLAFGWLFAFGALAMAILEFKNSFMVSVSTVMILFFIFSNLFTIHPTLWDPKANGVGGAASREDFAMADTVNFSRGEIIGYQNDIMTIYERQKIMGTDAYFLVDPVEINRYRWIVINREGLNEEGLYSSYTKDVIAAMVQLEASNDPGYNNMYESNNLAVFEKR